MKTSHVKKIVIRRLICQGSGKMKIDKKSIVNAAEIITAGFVKD